MTRRALASALCLTLFSATAVVAAPVHAKWPPWLSIEAPVNPFDPTSRGALCLVHATLREGQTQVSDIDGSAEGLVNGARRSVKLHFDTTSRPNVYAVRRQWPTEGTWLLRISLQSTTAIVTLGPDGSVASASVPTHDRLPILVTDRDIDAALAAAAKR
jgi:hypothetical protein